MGLSAARRPLRRKSTASSPPPRASTLPVQCTLDTFRTQSSTPTCARSTLKASPPTTPLPPGSLASLLAMLDAAQGSQTHAVRSLAKSCGLPPGRGLDYCSWRTSPGSSRTTAEGHSLPSSGRWMNAGTMRNGSALTARISFPRTDCACSLSDLLEGSPGDKYYLSRASTETLLRHAERRARKGTRRKEAAQCS